MDNPAARPRKRAWFFLQIAEGYSPMKLRSIYTNSTRTSPRAI